MATTKKSTTVAKKKNSVVAKNATTEKKETDKEWKPTGRKLEGEELKDHLKAFSDIDESIAYLDKHLDK